MSLARVVCSTALGLLISSSLVARAEEPAQKAATGGPPTVAAPFPANPIRFFSVPGDEVYALADDHKVHNLGTGQTVLEMSEPEKWNIVVTFCDVIKDHAACLYLATKTEGEGQNSTTYKRLVLATEENPNKVIASGSGKEYDVGPLGIHLRSEDGKPLFLYTETKSDGGALRSKTWLVNEGTDKEIEIGSESFLSKLSKIGGGDRVDPPVQIVEFKDKHWMVYRDGTDIVARAVKGQPNKVASDTLHDIRPVVTSDGWFYLFYHDARSNTADVAVSQDGKQWQIIELDGKESGWQMEAAARDELAVGAFYYFRNSFNKGLRVVMLKEGKLVEPAFTIVREEAVNTGWHPNLGIASDGTTWLTYLADVENKKRAWSRFPSPRELKKHELSGGSGWEEGYKNYFLQTGAGVWYTWWHLSDSVPKSDDVGGLHIGKTSYNVGSSLLTSGSIEARYGWFNLGASYAQSVVDDAAKSVDDSSGLFNGSVKVDDLMLGHDLKLGFIWGRYRGIATPGENVTGDPLRIKTNYTNVQLLLLNKWRIKYGLDYSTFNVPASVHSWYAAENATSYEYQQSDFRNVSLRNINGILGYSKLDYAAKYENHYNNVFLDGAFSIGWTHFSFDEVVTANGNKSSGDALNIRLIGQLGWLYFHRWQSARGLGIYLRPAYMADWTWLGSAGKPNDRESDKAKSSSLIARPGLSSVRHGPWFDVGIVW